MNSRISVKENELKVVQLIKRAKRVQKVRNITLLEAIDYGVMVSLKHANSNNEKSNIELLSKEAKKEIAI